MFVDSRGVRTRLAVRQLSMSNQCVWSQSQWSKSPDRPKGSPLQVPTSYSVLGESEAVQRKHISANCRVRRATFKINIALPSFTSVGASVSGVAGG
jgi:hypothetical protein